MKLFRKQIKAFLSILTVLAAIKMLFQSLNPDEEYQILMSYRQLMGDSMMDTMWEPHQTSSFLCTLFMWPYFKLFSTWTGIVIYLRLVGTLMHLAVSLYLYKILSYFLSKEYSFYLALICFNTIPKLIMLPEFGGMQIWFGILCFLLIIDSAECITFSNIPNSSFLSAFKIILAGMCMCLEVLSYPSCVLLFVPFIIMIWYTHKHHIPLKNCILFTATCGIIGGLYVGYFIIKLGPTIFFRNLDAILNYDLTHTFDAGAKAANITSGLLTYLFTFLIITVLSFALANIPLIKKLFPSDKKLTIMGLILVSSNIYQLWLWIFCNSGYEYLQIHLAITLYLALWILGYKFTPEESFTKYMWFGIAIGICNLACTLAFTDITILNSLSHCMLAGICVLALFAYIPNKSSYYTYFVLVFFCLTCCIGKGYTLRDSGGYNNIFQSRNICKYGPCIGTISNYIDAHIYNTQYQLWKNSIPEGSNVLVATDDTIRADTIQYLFKNAQVCHYSVIDPTSYDEKLLTYWSYYPDKAPDIIVLDCWFGDLLTSHDSWIVQYIENDFGYTDVIEGDYIKIYKK